MNNERQKLDLEITKTFEDEDPDAYKDVIFGIYSEDDIQVGDTVEIPEDGLVGILTLDENGKNKSNMTFQSVITTSRNLEPMSVMSWMKKNIHSLSNIRMMLLNLMPM